MITTPQNCASDRENEKPSPPLGAERNVTTKRIWHPRWAPGTEKNRQNKRSLKKSTDFS